MFLNRVFKKVQKYLVGGWTNPSEKYARQIGSFPQIGMKIKNVWNHHQDMFVERFFPLEVLLGHAVSTGYLFLSERVLPSLKLTYPKKIGRNPKGSYIVFQPSIFKGELLLLWRLIFLKVCFLRAVFGHRNTNIFVEKEKP